MPGIVLRFAREDVYDFLQIARDLTARIDKNRSSFVNWLRARLLIANAICARPNVARRHACSQRKLVAHGESQASQIVSAT